MRRRVHVLLAAAFGLAVVVLLTPVGFAVQGWLAPLAESRFAYAHPDIATAAAALLPWLVAGIAVHWHRPLLRLPGIFALVSWTAVVAPMTAITIRDAQPLHEWSGMALGREQMRTPPAHAAHEALVAGDCRPLAIVGFGPVTPEIDDLARPVRERFWSQGYRFIHGTGDVAWSGAGERHQARAYRYAAAYNRQLLAGLREPGGGVDWDRCLAVDSAP